MIDERLITISDAETELEVVARELYHLAEAYFMDDTEVFMSSEEKKDRLVFSYQHISDNLYLIGALIASIRDGLKSEVAKAEN